ncbi:amidohydrolase [Hydrotalea sandarakina]|jgi:predicted amidohydrolase|uniref:Omega-amidase YafV n=1 Tax=Hydrotalea sandarakina TaxID=1004304 RepID=A0A2W7S6N8_9BACT|nr:amidohydrolase [Hydrotalea sandarakina]PZX62907.1 putative amidohydrolase [Hydrotalea sandarakina]
MKDLRISLVQTHLQWEDIAGNLQQLEAKLQSIPIGTHIVVLPEMFSTGFSMQPERLAETMQGNTILWMKKMAESKKCIITGSLIIQENDCYYNRLIWMLPNGQMGFYDKRHCFAYAGEDKHYTPGNKRLIASVNGWKINVQICYDLRFPVWARQQANNPPEYDVLIYVANWPEKRIHAWKSLLIARAIENQCYVIGVNRIGNDGNGIAHSGDSMAINPLGEILWHEANKEAIGDVTLSSDFLNEVRSRFPFLADADKFSIHA